MPPQDNVGKYSKVKLKKARKRRILSFVVLSILLDLLFLTRIENSLAKQNGIDVVPAVRTEVSQHQITLTPPPDSSGTMTVSADLTLLALADTNRLRIYKLADGKEANSFSLQGGTLGAVQWLPDRSRLIYALMNNITAGNFSISLYSFDSEPGAKPQLIRTLHEYGKMPQKVTLKLSTYTNDLYIYWTDNTQNHLVQINIMKQIKDIRLLGNVTGLFVSPQNGDLWVELTVDNSPEIFKYGEGHWKQQKYLDGYKLLGVTPDDRLVVALDQQGLAKEFDLVDEKENFKPAWVLSSPLALDRVSIISDGSLAYYDSNRIIIHSMLQGTGTVFNISGIDGSSSDMRILVKWQGHSDQLNILEEVQETAQ